MIKVYLLWSIDSDYSGRCHRVYSSSEQVEKIIKEIDVYEKTSPIFAGDEFEHADTPAFKKYLKDYKKWEKKHPLFDGYSTPGHDHKYSIKEFEVLNEN